MTDRPINADTVGSLIANTDNQLTIALAESWLELLEEVEELRHEVATCNAAELGVELTRWEQICSDKEDEIDELKREIDELQEERQGAFAARRRAWVG